MKPTHILQSIGLVTVTVLITLMIQGAAISPENQTSEKISGNSYSPDGMEPFIGEITMFAGNFAPRGWAFCDGQLLPISQYSALFSILGTTYGGDGRTTFGLPDMRGRVGIHAGSGPGLSTYRLGQKAGSEKAALPLRETAIPGSETLGSTGQKVAQITGVNQVDVRQPYLSINYIIALQGIFPSRN
jgi:microcystin-dependent protein